MLEKTKRYVGAKLIREDKARGIAVYQRKNGATYIENIAKPQGSFWGDFVEVKGDLTEEKLAKAKEDVLEKLIEGIKDAANRYPESFFLIKTKEKENANPFGIEFPYDNTVACKVFLPNIVEYEDIYDEEVNEDDKDNV